LLRTPLVAKGNRDVIVLADKVSIDNTVAISGHQSTVARDTNKTGQVIHGSAVWRFHDELVGRNLKPTSAARAA